VDHLLRRAKQDDAGPIAYLTYLAGQGHVERSTYDLMFPGPPGPTPERLAEMARLLGTKTLSWFHYVSYAVIELEGQVVSALGTFAAREARKSVLVSALAEMGWTERDIAAMTENLRPYFNVEPPKSLDAWIIENVATLPGFRRAGFVNDLMEDAIRRGRQRGFRRMELSIFTGNVAAQRVYEKVGFRVTEEFRDDAFESYFGCPGMAKMELKL
jgi:ribosomal protein S18 acetylase RimI-like enzyme